MGKSMNVASLFVSKIYMHKVAISQNYEIIYYDSGQAEFINYIDQKESYATDSGNGDKHVSNITPLSNYTDLNTITQKSAAKVLEKLNKKENN